MNTRDLIKLIRDKLHYAVVGKEWSRIGNMSNKYGADAVEKAIIDMSTWSFFPPNLINTLEKQCQKHVSSTSSKIQESIKNIYG